MRASERNAIVASEEMTTKKHTEQPSRCFQEESRVRTGEEDIKEYRESAADLDEKIEIEDAQAAFEPQLERATCESK